MGPRPELHNVSINTFTVNTVRLTMLTVKGIMYKQVLMTVRLVNGSKPVKVGATKYRLAGRKWPPGRQFETPALERTLSRVKHL